MFSGVLTLARPLSELLTSAPGKSPIILSVLAEEVRSNDDEAPAQSSQVKLALIPPTPPGTTTQFSAKDYVTYLDENSPPETVLNLKNAEVITGTNTVLVLQLDNNNDTFEISPQVIKGKVKFSVKVKNSKMLDYESRRSVQVIFLCI